jgi:hypothetical protein
MGVRLKVLKKFHISEFPARRRIPVSLNLLRARQKIKFYCDKKFEFIFPSVFSPFSPARISTQALRALTAIYVEHSTNPATLIP